MLSTLHNLALSARMACRSLAYISRSRWRQTGPVPRKACRVPGDFFGLCVANAPESACDDYVIARVNELGIRHVRLDFTCNDRGAFTERFLDRLLAEGLRVCLHLVQPREDARVMLSHPEAATRWRAFVGDMLNRYGSRVELIEIGATCNRRKWSGYSPAAFLAAWQIAWEEARGRNLTIAGPNVTDFEPLYNAGWLGEFKSSGLLPGVHTDNLFVERATEPEAFDHKIAGQRLAGALRFNLVRKAQLLQDIGAWAGVPTLVCAHVTWSLRRIARFLDDAEEKQADYLARYACLAAASGALARVYWGPLIGQREGLIDDGTSEYPEIPHVTYYEQARGNIEDYRLRPAFRTFQTVNRMLAGAAFQRRLTTGAGLEILEFTCTDDGRQTTDNGRQTTDDKTLQSAIENQAPPERDGQVCQQSQIENLKSKILHAVWTTDGNGASADDCYPAELLARAEIYSRDGRKLERAPRMFSESPVFLVWPESAGNVASQASSVCRTENGQMTDGGGPYSLHVPHASILPGYRFARRTGYEFDVIRPESNPAGLAGVYLAGEASEHVDIQALLDMLRQSAEEVRGQRSEASGQSPPERSAQASRPAKIENRKSKILRDARNTVWSVSAPWDRQRALVVKAFKPRGFLRRLLDYGKPNKARRSWNGAQELLRRGLLTPAPLACLVPEKTASDNASIRPSATLPFYRTASTPNWCSRGSVEPQRIEIPMHRDCATSYYICDAFAPAWSARDVFDAFSAGAAKFQGTSATDWYEAIAVFLQKMHARGVFFGDLSAGNLLVRRAPTGELEFALIDTARARFYPRSLGLRLRLCDLMRICHPLSWAGRQIFAGKYLAHSGRRFSWWMKIPFWYYDGKHRLKNALKRRRKTA